MMPSEELLARAAQDGTMESAQWAGMFGNVLERLDQNVHKRFTIPTTSPPASLPPPPSNPHHRDSVPIPNDDTPKEIGPFPSSPPQPRSPQNDDTMVGSNMSSGTLPPPLQATYDYVRLALTTQFAAVPPHTVQRFAELILKPTEHHRFLHSYLSALDRVVSVSSGLDAYPSPTTEATAPLITSGPLVNGVNLPATSTTNVYSVGVEETRSGAMLTPIPWLQGREQVDQIDTSSTVSATATLPSDGVPERMTTTAESDAAATELSEPVPSLQPESDADVMDTTPPGPTIVGVSQGELLRQQQQSSSPPPPVSSLTSVTSSSTSPTVSARTTSPIVAPDTDAADPLTTAQDDHEQPHARGPEEIGMEDTGKQAHGLGSGQVLDMEAAVGRSATVSSSATTHADHGSNVEDEYNEDRELTRADDTTSISGPQGPEVSDGSKKDRSGDEAMPDADDAAAT